MTKRQKEKPRKLKVVLHNPNEPANMISDSFDVSLGYTTIVHITPRAIEFDESGKELTEEQRQCRLATDVHDLNIFNIYTAKACMFECKLGIALERCGCIPWSYPSFHLVYKFYNIILVDISFKKCR